MTFYRHAKIYIGFDCEDRDGKIHTVYGGDLREYEYDPVEFSDKDEAYTLGGNLEDWAESLAETVAKGEAESYCGDETFHAVNIDWKYENEREWEEIEVPPVPPVPSGTIAAIKGYENRAKSLRQYADRPGIIAIGLSSDFIQKAKEAEDKAMVLRIKYKLVGKEL